jgi:hypothetical protein
MKSQSENIKNTKNTCVKFSVECSRRGNDATCTAVGTAGTGTRGGARESYFRRLFGEPLCEPLSGFGGDVVGTVGQK